MVARRTVVAGAVIAAVLGGVGAALSTYAAQGGESPSQAGSADADTATVEVTRGDLALVEQVTGELGHGSPLTVVGRGDGMVTWLPSVGATVRRGEQLYRVDDAPVTVLFGDLPLYRTLAVPQAQDAEKGKPPVRPPDPAAGNDVDLVAANLAALGLWAGPTVDLRYDAALAGAVATWQEAQGLEGTGILEPSTVVVTRGPVRVEAVFAQVGADAAGEVLSVTGTRRVLALDVPPELARSLTPGRRIPVTLADGRKVRTTIRSIDGRATAGDAGGPPTVQVSLEPRRTAAVAKAPLGAVSGQVTIAARQDVLQVPITALVALAGGGYALERPDGTLVAVGLGMVAGGRAEVDGIDEGATVVVAS